MGNRVILSFDKCSFYIEICLEKTKEKLMTHWMQRQNHLEYLGHEDRCSPSISLKKNLPNQSQEGNHYCSLKILLHEQKLGKQMSSFLFFPF